MENTLAFAASDSGGFVGGRFAERHRIAQFWFRQRIDADQFCGYVQKNYPEAKTSLVLDFNEE